MPTSSLARALPLGEGIAAAGGRDERAVVGVEDIDIVRLAIDVVGRIADIHIAIGADILEVTAGLDALGEGVGAIGGVGHRSLVVILIDHTVGGAGLGSIVDDVALAEGTKDDAGALRAHRGGESSSI